MATVLVENTPPLVESVSIAPAVNLTTSSSLTCAAVVSDVDIDTPFLSYLWTNMTTGIELGVGDGLTLDSSMASPNDLIQCMVTATDSFGGTHELGETVGVNNLSQSFRVFRSIPKQEPPPVPPCCSNR